MNIKDSKLNLHPSSQCLANMLVARRVPRKIKALPTTALVFWLLNFDHSCWAMDNVATQTVSSVPAQVKNLKNSTAKLQNTLWGQIAKQHHLDPYILYAVALIESAKESDPYHVTPYPWALNKAGLSIIPSSRQEAHVILRSSIAEGNRHIDVGLMQINLHWHGHRVEKAEHLLDPVTNLKIGADILAEAIQSVPNDLALGIGRYHSWQNVHAAVDYGHRVLAVANQIRTVL